MFRLSTPGLDCASNQLFLEPQVSHFPLNQQQQRHNSSNFNSKYQQYFRIQNAGKTTPASTTCRLLPPTKKCSSNANSPILCRKLIPNWGSLLEFLMKFLRHIVSTTRTHKTTTKEPLMPPWSLACPGGCASQVMANLGWGAHFGSEKCQSGIVLAPPCETQTLLQWSVQGSYFAFNLLPELTNPVQCPASNIIIRQCLHQIEQQTNHSANAWAVKSYFPIVH